MEHNKEEASMCSGDEYFRKAVKTDLDSKNISNTPNTKNTCKIRCRIWSTNSPPVISKNSLLGLSIIIQEEIQEDGGFTQQNNPKKAE